MDVGYPDIRRARPFSSFPIRVGRGPRQEIQTRAPKNLEVPAEKHALLLRLKVAWIAALSAGMLVPTGSSVAQEEPEPEPEPQPRVVVAVIDSAPNPYHEFLHQGGSLYGASEPSSVTPDVLDEFGIDESHIIEVTRTGDFTADFAKDKAKFDAIEAGEPYWFEGTNLIGISFNGDAARLRPDVGTSSHGMGTTSAVLAANPEAIVVLVQSPGAPLGVPGYATRPLGERWAFSHPAVDLISTSYGPPGSPPLGYHLTDAYKGVVENGKIHVGAADNSPALSPVDATSGPWFTVGVAGYGEGSSEGRQNQSGSLPDFLGDFTQTLPYCLRCEEGKSTVSGTSFATPRTAGTLSKVILEARRTAGHLRGIITGGCLSARDGSRRSARPHELGDQAGSGGGGVLPDDRGLQPGTTRHADPGPSTVGAGRMGGGDPRPGEEGDPRGARPSRDRWAPDANQAGRGLRVHDSEHPGSPRLVGSGGAVQPELGADRRSVRVLLAAAIAAVGARAAIAPGAAIHARAPLDTVRRPQVLLTSIPAGAPVPVRTPVATLAALLLPVLAHARRIRLAEAGKKQRRLEVAVVRRAGEPVAVPGDHGVHP